MLRYLDVGAEQRVTIAGEAMRAIPIQDRLGLEGSVTTHYVSSNGKYLRQPQRRQRGVGGAQQRGGVAEDLEGRELSPPGGREGTRGAGGGCERDAECTRGRGRGGCFREGQGGSRREPEPVNPGGEPTRIGAMRLLGSGDSLNRRRPRSR